MQRRGTIRIRVLAFLLVAGLLTGCRAVRTEERPERRVATAPARRAADQALELEYPAVEPFPVGVAATSMAPRMIADGVPTNVREVSLNEVVRAALQNSRVMRDLGGRVLKNPDAVVSAFDPAIRESDPRFGTEAALSAFDTSLGGQFFYRRNDQVINNEAITAGQGEITQDLASLNLQLTKTAATGTQFYARSWTLHDRSDNEALFFQSAWDTFLETGFRHPLLQGGGLQFNRIAGPNAQPGFYFTNGVLIARTNTDISLATFEEGVRDLVSQVVDAYWDLYAAYRELDARQQARDGAYQTWRVVHAKAERRLRGGEAENEAQAREQYYRYQELLEEALAGGATGDGGLFRSERRLRQLMGWPARDGAFLRPRDEPYAGRIVYDWPVIQDQALARRVELRRQQWRVKQRELQLLAARNFTLPRLDAVTRYRLRGFGDNLAGDGPRFYSAWQDQGTFDRQEWEFGMELTVPIGYRQGRAAVRFAELQLAREREIYREQELRVSHDLSDAVSQVDQLAHAIDLRYNRLVAADERVRAADAAYGAEQTPLNLVLEAQQRLSEAMSLYYRARVDYAMALKNVSLQAGVLLADSGVFLAEGPWPGQASDDARRNRRRSRPGPLRGCLTRPGAVSRARLHQTATASAAILVGDPAEKPVSQAAAETGATPAAESSMSLPSPDGVESRDSQPPPTPEPGR
jgi:outer membrane protein TolC